MNNPLKNLFSKLSNRFSKNNHFLGAWIIYHGVILVFFLFVWLINGSHVAVDADLFNMLPKPFQEHSVPKLRTFMSITSGCQSLPQEASIQIPVCLR